MVSFMHPFIYPLSRRCCFILSVRSEKRCSVEQIRRWLRARLYGRLRMCSRVITSIKDIKPVKLESSNKRKRYFNPKTGNMVL